MPRASFRVPWSILNSADFVFVDSGHNRLNRLKVHGGPERSEIFIRANGKAQAPKNGLHRDVVRQHLRGHYTYLLIAGNLDDTAE